MLFQNFPKPTHNTTTLLKLEIFFHVLVYSCQPIVASVRFKVPQVVVSSQSAVLSKIWTNWFNRANDWIGAISNSALLQRLFARVTIRTWQRPETALEKSLAPRVGNQWWGRQMLAVFSGYWIAECNSLLRSALKTNTEMSHPLFVLMQL